MKGVNKETFTMMTRTLLLATLVCVVACNSKNPPAQQENRASNTVSEPAATPTSQDNSKVCALFSAADAQKIMGVPMQPKPNRGAIVCMYEEAKQRPNSIGQGTVALTLVQSESADAENSAWARLKEVRHLAVGEKNVKQLSGIGDEAYFTGNTEKGKVGVSAVIVRKGNAHFMIDTMVLEYVASPNAMISVAKEIAGKL